MESDIDRRRELVQRLVRANARIRELQQEVEAAGNVVHFRMTRHVQSVTELLADLDARSIDMPAAHTDERRQLERDLAALEDEIAFVEAKLEAARAEESGDLRREARANARAATAQVSAVRSEFEDAPSSRPPAGDDEPGDG
jgi:predicted  nucleic acid-binding Zn-ribbon protein